MTEVRLKIITKVEHWTENSFAFYGITPLPNSKIFLVKGFEASHLEKKIIQGKYHLLTEAYLISAQQGDYYKLTKKSKVNIFAILCHQIILEI